MDSSRKVCVLTGASGVLGRAFIRQFASRYSIVAVYNAHRLDFPDQSWKVIDPLDLSKVDGPSVYSIKADLSSEKGVRGLVEEVLDVFRKVDILINSAAHRHFGRLLAADSLDDVALSFAVNVLAPLRISVAFAKEYWAFRSEENLQQNRNVVNISSTAGSYIYQEGQQAVYSSTKSGLNFASYHMANEFWDIGVRVNSVAPNTFPGIVATQSVIDSMIALIEGKETGRLEIIDR